MTAPDPTIACAGKHGFPSPVEARQALRHHRKPGAKTYRCVACGLWHIGSTLRRKR